MPSKTDDAEHKRVVRYVKQSEGDSRVERNSVERNSVERNENKGGREEKEEKEERALGLSSSNSSLREKHKENVRWVESKETHERAWLTCEPEQTHSRDANRPPKTRLTSDSRVFLLFGDGCC